MDSQEQRRRELALARAEELDQMRDQDPFVTVILERNREAEFDEDTGERMELDRPDIPKDLRIGYLSCLPPIELPTGRAVFYCRMRATSAGRLLRDERVNGDYLGESWTRLLETRYPYWPYALEYDGVYSAMPDDEGSVRGRFTECQPGTELKAIRPHSVFAGHEREELSLETPAVQEFVPAGPVQDGSAENYEENQHIFLIANFGVPFEQAEGHVALSQGAAWWSALYFPMRDRIVREMTDQQGPEDGPWPFSGALTIPHAGDIGNSHRRWREDFDDALAQVQRIRAILHLLDQARFSLVGYFSMRQGQRKTTSIRTEWYRDRRYRSFRKTRLVRQSLFERNALTDAVSMSLAKPRKKSILRELQRSADCFDISRQVRDPAIGHVLTWAAIETLISQKGQGELVSNMALALMGLDRIDDPPGFWRAAKESYAVRSRVVHSFDVPGARELESAIVFAEARLRNIFTHAAKTALPQGISRSEMTSKLQEVALSRMGA